MISSSFTGDITNEDDCKRLIEFCRRTPVVSIVMNPLLPDDEFVTNCSVVEFGREAMILCNEWLEESSKRTNLN